MVKLILTNGWTQQAYIEMAILSDSMDEDYLLAACRYIEMNPVRAKLVAKPEDYRWSSAKAHLSGRDDNLVKVKPMLDRVGNWAELLASGDRILFDEVRKHERTGRPLGNESFVARDVFPGG